MSLPLPDDLNDLTFLAFEDVLGIHAYYLASGQIEGVKSEHGLRSAIGRAEQAACYDEDRCIERIAAYYWHGISANHGFHDGNKRAGYFSMLAFLNVNGFEFVGPDEQMGEIIYRLFETNCFTVDALQSLIERHIRRLV